MYIIAGEASGDVLGASIMAALQQRMPNLQLHGVGGVQLTRQCGLASLFPMEELSLMGFWEILPHIPKLKRRMKEVAEDIAEKQPDIVLSIDSPGFTYRVAKLLKHDARTNNIPRIHAVAPTVWAYKPNRAAKTAALFDAILCLLPFEPSYFEAEGMQAHYMGHPVTERVIDKHAFTAPENTRLLTVLPGSRAGELRYHLPIFTAALRQLLRVHPDLHVAIPTQPHLQQQVAEAFADLPHSILTNDAAKWAAYAQSEAALCKSGTSSLELSHANVPHIVAYKVHPITAYLVRKMVQVPYASLVNLLLHTTTMQHGAARDFSSQPIVPEFIQQDCTPDALFAALDTLLRDATARTTMQSKLQESMQQLQSHNMPPSEAAATLLEKYLCV